MAGHNQIVRILYILATYAGVASFQVKVTQVAGTIGGKTVLRCAVIPINTPVNLIKWEKAKPATDTCFIYGSGNQPKGPQNDFKSRKVSGKFVNASGYHELSIEDTVLSDAQTYGCSVFSGGRSNSSRMLVQLPQPPAHGPVLFNQSDGVIFSRKQSECEDVVVPCDKKWLVLACRTAASNPESVISWEPKTLKYPYSGRSEKNKTLGTTIRISFANVTIDGQKTVSCTANYVSNVAFVTAETRRVCLKIKPSCAGYNNSTLPAVIIGVLIILVIVAIILVAIWFYRRRKRKRGSDISSVPVEAGNEATEKEEKRTPDADSTRPVETPLLQEKAGAGEEKSDVPEDAVTEETESPLLAKTSEEDKKPEQEQASEDTSLLGKLGKLFGKGKTEPEEPPSEEVTTGEDEDSGFQLTGKTQETKSLDELITHKVDFEIAIGEEKVGTLVFGLIGEKTPHTVAYFLKLVDGKRKHGYKNSMFHKIWQGQYVEGGKGVQVESASSSLADEHFRLLHCDAGWISLGITDQVSESSQFAITTGDVARMLDDQIFFGKVLEGLDVLDTIDKAETDNMKPKKAVQIIKTRSRKVTGSETVRVDEVIETEKGDKATVNV